MQYNITYIDQTNSMTVSNNPSEYDYNVEGIIPLSAPTLSCGEFRGWFTDAGFTTRIIQLDSSITSNLTIYAYVQTVTQLQVLGSSITEIQDLSSEPYLLFTNRISSGQSRSLLAMTPSNYSGQVTGAVAYIKNNSGRITASLNSIRQEYFIDLNLSTELLIEVPNHSSSRYLIFHFTRGTGNSLDNFQADISIKGPVINGLDTTTYNITVGSTIIFIRSNNEWTPFVYLNPELSEIVAELTDNILDIRNYSFSGLLNFSPESADTYGGRNSIEVRLPGLDLSGFSNDIIYKSIFIQFDTSAYDLSGADITVLNKKQGYLNLIGVQPAKLVYDSMNNNSTLKLTYDYIPAYRSSSLSDYTLNIPVKIMVVI